MTYTLAVEDATLKSSAAFRADRIRPLSTAEMTYVLHDPAGLPVLSGYLSRTSAQSAVKMKSLQFGSGGDAVDNRPLAPIAPATPPTP